MDGAKVRLVRLPFLIPTWAAAQVLLPNTVFLNRGVTPDRRLIAHELSHIDDLNRLGLLRYWWAYLVENIRYGYEDNIYEVGARAAETDPRMLEWADRVIEANPQIKG